MYWVCIAIICVFDAKGLSGFHSNLFSRTTWNKILNISFFDFLNLRFHDFLESSKVATRVGWVGFTTNPNLTQIKKHWTRRINRIPCFLCSITKSYSWSPNVALGDEGIGLCILQTVPLRLGLSSMDEDEFQRSP